jgi:antitoxin FitA
MGRMIQLRNVPEQLHRTLKARAALAGMSLSDYLLQEIKKSAERPTPQEMAERLASREPVKLGASSARVIREERESRERELERRTRGRR